MSFNAALEPTTSVSSIFIQCGIRAYDISVMINIDSIVIQIGIRAYDISVACKQRIGDVRHLLIMHIIELRSSNLR